MFGSFHIIFNGRCNLCFSISLLSYILLLFKIDGQEKRIFSISDTALKLWLVEISVAILAVLLLDLAGFSHC